VLNKNKQNVSYGAKALNNKFSGFKNGKVNKFALLDNDDD
jgi:hypothetical protein